jgi:DNA repair exonuclease SbcCD ATPase subunit
VLKSIQLTNYRQFEKLNLDFAKINVISGDTGSGKSSILEGLSLVLCNKTKNNLDSCIKRGTNKAEVQLKFDTLFDSFNCKIGLGKTTTRELVINGQETFYNSDVLKKLESIIDPKLTLYSNFSIQKKTSEILLDKPTPRLQKIKSIFKIDKINKNVIPQIKNDIDNLNLEISKIEGEISVLNSQNFVQIEEPVFEQVDQEVVIKQIKDLKDLKVLCELAKAAYNKYLLDFETYSKQQEEIKKLLQNKEISEKILIELKNKIVFSLPQ